MKAVVFRSFKHLVVWWRDTDVSEKHGISIFKGKSIIAVANLLGPYRMSCVSFVAKSLSHEHNFGVCRPLDTARNSRRQQEL